MPEEIKTLAEHLAEIEDQGSRLRRGTRRATRAMPLDDRQRLSERADAILREYDGVQAEHSFAGTGGAVFDSIPIEQQPALKRSGQPPAKPVDMPGTEMERPDRRSGAVVTGNALATPSSTVPLRRLRIEDALTLKSHRKQPPPLAPLSAPTSVEGGLAVAPPAVAAGFSYHRYAVYGFGDGTTTVGGFAYHSANQVPIDSSKGEVFSLSQQWYMQGTGSRLNQPQGTIANAVQSVEVGLQCMPSVWGTPGPSLFICTTNDGYDNFHYHGLSPGSPFVQTNNLWAVTDDLSPISSLGGAQRYLGVGALLVGGNWWVYLNDKSASGAVGYYPANWWRAGSGMATAATRCEWGGEIATSALGQPPQANFQRMGSGRKADRGFPNAAYIRNIQHYPNSNNTTIPPAPLPQNNTTVSSPDPGPGATRLFHQDQYGYFGQVNGYAQPWNRTLWYGGPGSVMNTDTFAVTLASEP